MNEKRVSIRSIPNGQYFKFGDDLDNTHKNLRLVSLSEGSAVIAGMHRATRNDPWKAISPSYCISVSTEIVPISEAELTKEEEPEDKPKVEKEKGTGKRGRKPSTFILIIPQDKEFSMNDLVASHGKTSAFIYNHLKKLIGTKIKVSRQLSTGRGKPTNFYTAI